jgi:DNA ligase (NAD+)
MENKESALKRIKEIKNSLQKWSYAYYVLNTSIVEDGVYDALFEELLRLETDYPDLQTPDSPTQKIGSDLKNNFKEYSHLLPMLSLDKLYSLELLEKWVQKYSQQESLVSVEPKVDGFSCALYYEKGVLVRALSRGNGVVGNDITNNIKTIASLPLSIESELSYVMRGEVFISKKDFLAINNTKEENIYANPRNFAAGVIRRIHSQEVSKVPLKILIYEASCLQDPFSSHQQMLRFLFENHFPLSNLSFFVNLTSMEENRNSLLFDPPINDFNYDQIYQNQKELPTYEYSKLSFLIDKIMKNRSLIPFDIDGVVLKLNNYKLRDSLGATSHHPKWAMAYKFESPKAISKVLDIKIQVGRTGKITPLALLTPTNVNGSTVSRATLHNQDYINSLELGIGDSVEIAKRGEIIPSIEKVIEKTSPHIYVIPSCCPVCLTSLKEKGAHLFCPNPDCPSRIKGNLLYFAQTLEMEGFGESLINLLYDEYHLKSPSCFFTFDYNELLKKEGFKDKKVSNLKKSLSQVLQKTSFSTLIKALGVPEINEKIISILFEYGYSHFEQLKQINQKENLCSILEWEQIGEVGANRILEVFRKDSKTMQTLEELIKLGFSDAQKQEKNAPLINESLKNTVWVITGTLSHFHPRALAMKAIMERAGEVKNTITKDTTHLLVGKNPSSKLEKAKKRGIMTLQEKEFLDLIKES